MVFQVSSNCRMFMLANALVQVSGCVPDNQMQPKTNNSIVLSVPFRFAHSCVTGSRKDGAN